MKSNITIAIILITTFCYSQSITKKELIGKWKIKKIEITQIFCNTDKSYSWKDSIIKYYNNTSLEFLKTGEMIHYPIKKMENPLPGFEKQNWSFENENEILLKGEISELGLIVREIKEKYYFDFFHFMIFEMEKELTCYNNAHKKLLISN
jgi:hypothetical protein